MADLLLHPRGDLAATAVGGLVVEVTGALEADTAQAHRDEMVALCPGDGTALVLDLSRVDRCEAAGLALLVTARQVMRGGGPLVLVAPSLPVAKMLRVTGLARSFTVCVTLRTARAAVAQPHTTAVASGRDTGEANVVVSYDARSAAQQMP